jgi:hypothetical protein
VLGLRRGVDTQLLENSVARFKHQLTIVHRRAIAFKEILIAVRRVKCTHADVAVIPGAEHRGQLCRREAGEGSSEIGTRGQFPGSQLSPVGLSCSWRPEQDDLAFPLQNGLHASRYTGEHRWWQFWPGGAWLRWNSAWIQHVPLHFDQVVGVVLELAHRTSHFWAWQAPFFERPPGYRAAVRIVGSRLILVGTVNLGNTQHPRAIRRKHDVAGLNGGDEIEDLLWGLGRPRILGMH